MFSRALPRKSAGNFGKVQALSGQSADRNSVVSIAAWFRLPWSHYVRLLAVRNLNAREFYESEALRGGWTNYCKGEMNVCPGMP
jgi:hypothetical protein